MKVQTLERVEMVATNGDQFPQVSPMYGPVARWLGSSLRLVKRDWVVERDVRDDSRNIFHVREIDKASTLAAQAESLKDIKPYFREVWQRVWPAADDTDEARNWWEQWESWPLDLRPVDER